MKNFVFTALAILSLVFGTVTLTAPANAYTFAEPNQNAGANS